MEFKKGMGWKACYDETRNLYTAETGGPGAYDLYEITEEIYRQLDKDNPDSSRLIHSGRHLYMDVNDRCGPPYTVILDEDYKELCPWANIIGGKDVWPAELTDAAVEVFASEANNRPQRRRRRKERERKKQGMELQWEEGFEIRVRAEDGSAVISGNREGLLSLSNHLKALAEEPAGSHLHLDENNSLEDGSAELILEKI